MSAGRKTLTVVGLGLIGGSLARAVKTGKLPFRVLGVARRESTRREALEAGAVDEAFAEPADAASVSDIVVLALPVLTIPSVLRAMAPSLRPGTVVSDVGSTKVALIAEAEKTLPPEVPFVGAHPIAGTEDSGFEASFPELFRGARCILTPGERSTPEAVATIRDLWERIGSRVETMDPTVHDRILAVISHLPHVVAYALVNAAASYDREIPGLLGYTGGGFRDFTRIAASHSAMWRDICLDNRREILAAIDRFMTEMGKLRECVVSGDGHGLESAFDAARAVRRSLPDPQGEKGA